MGNFRRILQNRRGDTFIFILILVFFILTLSAILIEYFRMESLYQQVEYVLQRGVNSSVEYAMMDEYRKDGYARLNSALAKEKLYEYFHQSMNLDTRLNKYAGEEWVYELEIKNIKATDNPPRLTLDGVIKTRSIFNFLTGEVKLPFSISSVNNRIEEGGF
ncbi:MULTISPECIES: TadE/TadG family type IV pilus assembly protein [Thermotaleaceae]|uniref:Flp pilus-assembly TadE/G-like n=1 Tax=Geosporobacter subterraneus DSM 17957 TaxID=1121919 RepID=A0A1M6HSC9_9FIRM|nr:hypothetical protein [Geosporobacter subterraneus]SHJ25057.1 hypothetical protein SAMN02745975_01619 [Geosporobacter subterraneus DSM 17957]